MNTFSIFIIVLLIVIYFLVVLFVKNKTFKKYLIKGGLIVIVLVLLYNAIDFIRNQNNSHFSNNPQKEYVNPFDGTRRIIESKTDLNEVKKENKKILDEFESNKK